MADNNNQEDNQKTTTITTNNATLEGTGDSEESTEGLLSLIQSIFNPILTPQDLNATPFKIGWYNDLVGPHFTLNYPPNTLAYVVLSGAEVFEKCVVPYLKSRTKINPQDVIIDPLDDAMVNIFNQIQQEVKKSLNHDTEALHDFQLYPSRKPKVLVQTAAHVAGVVQYFHKTTLPVQIQQDVFSKEAKLSGVALHPVHGGWFAIRGVIVFKNVEIHQDDKRLSRPPPLNLIPDEENIVTLLKEFAYNWEQDKWRTIYKGDGQEYSQDFKDFLTTLPGERWQFLKDRGFLEASLFSKIS